jgi:O-antigen ligase
MAALLSISILLAGTLLYPDYLVTVGWRVGPIRVSPMGLLFVLAAPSVLWYFWKQKMTLKYSAVDAVLVAALLFVGIRGAFAATNSNELGLVVGYIGYALLLYYGAAVVGQKKGALRTLFIVLVSSAVFIATYALVEFALGRNIIFEGIIKENMMPYTRPGYHRSGSTLVQPDSLGAFMVQVSPFFIFFFFKSAGSRKVAWGATIVLCMLALLLTYSKGGWGTATVLILAGLIFIGMRRRVLYRSLLILLMAGFLVLGLFTAAFHGTVYSGTFSKARTSESFKPRQYMWSRVPATFIENPLIGAGMWQGSTEVIRVSQAPEAKNRPSSIDNIYLTVLVEQGIIGFLLTSATLILFGLQAVKLLRSGGSIVEWGLPVAASMTLILISGLAMTSLMVWPNMVVFWLSAGMLRSLVERARLEGSI